MLGSLFEATKAHPFLSSNFGNFQYFSPRKAGNISIGWKFFREQNVKCLEGFAFHSLLGKKKKWEKNGNTENRAKNILEALEINGSDKKKSLLVAVF